MAEDEKIRFDFGAFAIDVLDCPKCSGRMKLIAFRDRRTDKRRSGNPTFPSFTGPSIADHPAAVPGTGRTGCQSSASPEGCAHGAQKSEYEGHCFSASLAANSSSSLMIEFWQRTGYGGMIARFARVASGDVA